MSLVCLSLSFSWRLVRSVREWTLKLNHCETKWNEKKHWQPSITPTSCMSRRREREETLQKKGSKRRRERKRERGLYPVNGTIIGPKSRTTMALFEKFDPVDKLVNYNLQRKQFLPFLTLSRVWIAASLTPDATIIFL